jgi:hypothetical protein
MSDTATLLEALSDAAPADWARPLVDRQLAILGRLAEAGLEIAIVLEGQAKGGDAVVEGDVAMAFNRVARAVRQTLMLQSRLIESLQAQQAARANRKAAVRASAARIVRSVIEDDRSNDAERSERLAAEAAERLEREDFGDLLSRPFGEAVIKICKDLGLSPDWLTLAEDCHAAEAAVDGRVIAMAETPCTGPTAVRWLGDGDSS